MKKLLLSLIILGMTFSLSFAQTAKIVTEGVTPHELETLGFATNSVSTGLDVVANGTYVYLSAKVFGTTDPITTAVFNLIAKPATSTAALEVVNPTWVQFLTDIKGEYKIQLVLTTAGGTFYDTTTIYSGSFVGVGNFEGVAAQFPQCMTCHAGSPTFTAIFDKWKVSGHATIFQEQLSTSTHYSTSCMKCHTTGYDHNLVAANNGFDDIAANLGWTFTPPTSTAKWDSLKTYFAPLVNHATIGCESCHGPGSEHGMGGIKAKIQITNRDEVCGQCHDEPWRHNKYAQYENSLHSEALWSSSFARNNTDNSISGNCSRCHEAQGYIDFSKGEIFNASALTEAEHIAITCQTCHDPHGNGEVASIRPVPVGSDTLGNGYSYTGMGGAGQTCMNCHKARRDNVTYVPSGNLSSHWGPHHSVQSDVFFGQNAASFGTAFQSSAHKFAVGDACVTCHMSATVDTGNVNRDKVGGHSFKLHNADTDYYHTASCTNCHGPKTSWDDFIAASDFDGDETVESIPQEIDGLLALLVNYLPPVGVDSIDYTLIGTDTTMRKAYWNYMLIAYDGSKGMHNAKFAIDVLSKSIIAIGGEIPVELTAFNAKAEAGRVTLTWETATETNNSGFEVERKINQNWVKLGFVSGKGTTTELNTYSYVDNLKGVNAESAIYRLKQIDFDGTSQYSKEINVELVNGPKDYVLSQNYPNPFNPSTSISFTLPFESKVKLVVYNLTGEVVRELVNEIIPAGSHESSFNMSNLASGVYFYSIEAVSVDGSKSFKQTRKMVMMK